jgi:hypothetical protein
MVLTTVKLQNLLNIQTQYLVYQKEKKLVMILMKNTNQQSIPKAKELTPPSLRTFDMISIYSTILCAVSRKKQVTTASHAAGTTNSIAKNVKIALLYHTGTTAWNQDCSNRW